MIPPTAPMIGAAQYSMYPEGAVIATRPAIAPLPAMPMSIVLRIRYMVDTAAITPAAAARFVTSTISANRLPIPAAASPKMPRVEPGLNPNQPSHRIRTPSPTSGIECPGIARGLPPFVYLPRRGPSSSSAARAPVAPIRWTTVEPAKSCMPMLTCSQPPPKIQWLITG